MGHKKVCLDCRKVFNGTMNFEKFHVSTCAFCGKQMEELNHLFQPPKQKEIKKWEVVKFLVENGFRYYHIWGEEVKNKTGECIGLQNTKYPETMKDAKEFVIKYAKHSEKYKVL